MAGNPIASVYVEILPETSRVAEGIRRAFREADPAVREAGGRWKKEIESQLKDVKVKVDADTTKAKAEVKSIGNERVSVKVDVDRSSGLGALLGGGGSLGGALKLNAGLVGIGLLPAAATAIANVAGAVQQLAGAGLAIPGVFAGIASSIGTASLGMAGMKDALDAVTKASDGTQASVDAANKALAELSPNAAETVRTVAGLKGTFDDLQHIAGQNMFAGVSEGLKGLVGNLLPAATQGIDGISRSLNQNLLQTMNSLGSGSSQGFLSRILGNTADAQGQLTGAIDPIVHAMGTLAAAGSDTLPRLAAAVGKVADRFNDFITAADGDGRLAKWISEGLDGFTHLGNIALNLGKTFTAITQAAGGGAGLLGTLESATQRMQLFLNSSAGQQKLMDFFAQGRDMLGQLKDVAVELGPILSGVFQAGFSAASLWLPVIREILSDINSIPGGAATVVAVFATWKTISAVGTVATGLTNLLGLLRSVGPAAAAAGAEGAAGLSPLITKLGIVAGAVAALPNIQNVENRNIPGASFFNGLPTPDNLIGDISRGLQGQPTNIFGPHTTTAADQAEANRRAAVERAKSNPGGSLFGNGLTGGASGGGPSLFGNGIAGGGAPAPVVVLPPPNIPVPAVSTYVPPVVTQGSGGGGGGGGGVGGTTAGRYAGGYTSDAALLANVPSGRYDASGDLSKGLGDCSSAVEDLVNLMQGQSTAGRSMNTGNAAEWLTAHGFIQGSMPGAFNVGFNSEHMQATLPGGTPFNWGSNSAAARGGVGGSGASDPALTSRYYLPVQSTYGSKNYGSSKSTPMYVMPADEKAFGGGDAKQLGQDFLSGMLQIFGIDGSFLPDPTQFGITKFISGAANLKVKGSDGSSMPMAGGGGGGGLLGFASQLMPGSGGNSPNLLDAVQFAQTGAPNSPGPGNNSGYQNSGIDLRGSQFGPTANDFMPQLNAVTSSQNRWGPLLQNAPK